jgi:thiamine biosynthesis lipoprotein
MPKKVENSIERPSLKAVPGAMSFAHEAMATVFKIFILGKEHAYAAQAAQEAFSVLDRLEQELSRFVENSDVTRVNNVRVNEDLTVGLATFECLQTAKQVFEETEGAFDITIGSLMKCWLDKDKNLLSPSKQEIAKAKSRTGMDWIKLDKQWYTVKVLNEGVRIDLGGIGKGYALDKMAEVLREWNIEKALMHGGGSTVLAMDSPEGMKGWPVTISSPSNRKKRLGKLFLVNSAISGSGLAHGQHIIDPRKGKPVSGRAAAWSTAKKAATADALSTAFMVMEPDEIERYCRNKPEVGAIVVIRLEKGQSKGEKVLQFGNWDQ